MAALPDRVKYLVIGAGVHGLSTAWHLAKEQRARGEEPDVLIVDKTGIGAGASGIACGVVRNNYFQPAMSELMAANVEVWEQDPEAFSYHPVGYVALGCERQVSDLTAVVRAPAAHRLPVGADRGRRAGRGHMREMFPDWRAQGVEVCLHEQKGGYANNMASMQGLAAKARRPGRGSSTASRVTGFDMDGSGAVKTVHTDQGDIAVEQVVVGVGPWVATIWEMLGLPDRIDVRTPEGEVHADQEMWTYWYLQEGEIAVDPRLLSLPDGSMPPVLHVDSDAPLYADEGTLITDELWGNYFKQDLHGVQGGAAPVIVGNDVRGRSVPDRERRVELRRHVVRVALALHEAVRGQAGDVQERALGRRRLLHRRQLPGLRLHVPERLLIADSNHGYKMIGVGREVAQVMTGGHSSLLYPFRYERFATGDLHPVSNSPYPWS